MEKRLIENKKVILTGGHAASSAFVVTEEIRRQKKPWDVYWIGFKSSIEGENISTLSSIYFPKYNIKTYNLFTGRIQRKWTIHTLPSLLKIPVGFIHAFWLIFKINPDLVLSFGGFSAFPVVVMAYLRNIPVIIHEQTSVVGRANRYSSFFARKIAVSRDTSKAYFPKDKTVLTGNPIPREIYRSENRLGFSKKPTVLITGGQSGSVALNSAVEKALRRFLNEYKVIHLTGLKDEAKFKKIYQTLNHKHRKNYAVFGIVDPREYNKLFNESSVIISRAGENTVSKIVASGKASVLVPLPISYLNEQKKNAEFAAEYGGARVIDQKSLKPERLFSEMEYLVKNWEKIAQNIKKIDNPDKDASEKLVSLMKEYIK